jgi:hypothetical protein
VTFLSVRAAAGLPQKAAKREKKRETDSNASLVANSSLFPSPYLLIFIKVSVKSWDLILGGPCGFKPP